MRTPASVSHAPLLLPPSPFPSPPPGPLDHASDRPSRLDALLYGYLAAIIAAPLPVGELQQLVQSYEPLVQFTQRVQRQFFATR